MTGVNKKEGTCRFCGRWYPYVHAASCPVLRHRTAEEEAEFNAIKAAHQGDPTWARYQVLASKLPPVKKEGKR